MKRWAYSIIVGGVVTAFQPAPAATAQDQPIDPASFESMLSDTRVNPESADQALLQRGLLDPIKRGSIPTVPVDWIEDFQTHPLSTDPVFDRFQVAPGQGHLNPVFNWTAPTSTNAIPSLFIDGQTDEFGTPDPLPRWGGIALVESLPTASADLNGDGIVDSSDLALLIGAFGTACSGCAADINIDGQVNSSDLALCIGVFGDVVGPFCVYEVTLVQPVDDTGMPLPPGTLDDGPFTGDRIGFTASPSCGTCDRFSLRIDGVSIFGDWTLVDSSAPDLLGALYFGAATSADCPPITSTERVLALARGETGASNPNCCFQQTNGVLTDEIGFVTRSSSVDGIDLVCEMDIFLPSHDTFVWADITSSIDGLTMSRLFTGGVGANVLPGFEAFSNQAGLVDRFIILGADCGSPFCGSAGGLFGTVPDPDYVDPVTSTVTPLPGKKSLTGEWFTVRHVVTTQSEHEVWIRDSETMALVDPMPGDDGGSTDSILDDIEDGFAKLFPVGPYGRTRMSHGRLAENVAIPISTSATRVRTILGAEDGTLQRANRNYFIDNIRISGASPVITPPPLTLPYLDTCDSYFIGPISLGTAGDRWSESTDMETIVYPGDGSFGGEPSIRHTHDSSIDDVYRTVFWTDLPDAVAAPASPWRVGTSLMMNSNEVVRGVTPTSTVLGEPVTTVLLGVEEPFSDPGVVVRDSQTRESRIHVRQRNPHFDPGSPADNWEPDWGPPAGLPTDPGYPNIEFMNVATNSLIDEFDFFKPQLLEIEVTESGALRVYLEGVELLPADPDRFYDATPGDITQFSTDVLHIDRLNFDSGFQPIGSGKDIDVDDVTLTGSPAS